MIARMNSELTPSFVNRVKLSGLMNMVAQGMLRGLGKPVVYLAVTQALKGFHVSRALAAVTRSGLLEALSEQGGCRVDEYARSRGMNPEIALALCHYLVLAGFLRHQDGRFRWTSWGKWYSESEYLQGLVLFVHSFRDIYEHVEDALRDRARYPDDFRRDGELLGRASASVGRSLYFPVVRDHLRRQGARTVLDLGCGSGEFLMALVLEEDMTGYGLDLSKDAVEFGRRLAREHGLDRKLDLWTQDMFAVETMRARVPSVDAVTGFVALHEFLNDQARLVRWLSALRAAYPAAHCYFLEFTPVDREALQRRARLYQQTFAPEYLFMHDLTDQRLASVETWRALFRECGFGRIEAHCVQKVGADPLITLFHLSSDGAPGMTPAAR